MEPMYDGIDAEEFAQAEAEKPFDYFDAEGKPHVMCACGHWVTGPALGTKIALCPNCEFRARFGERIPLVNANRMPVPSNNEIKLTRTGAARSEVDSSDAPGAVPSDV